MEEREQPADLRDEIFESIEERVITAAIIANDAGILSGVAATGAKAEELGLTVERISEEGSEIGEGEEVARFSGSPRQIALAEEYLIGLLAKPSGVATAARAFVKTAGKKPKVVCGAWKKMPPADKEAIRQAVVTGGADYRITDRPFVYLDKNYIEMFGGIRESMEAVSGLAAERTIVVQIKGRYASIIKEALEAAECGAGIVFVDTGVPLDFMEAAFELERAGLRKKVKIAFGGNLDLKGVRVIKKDKFGIDIVDVGRKIVDAPLLDMRLEVLAVDDGDGVRP
jgi:nicotinate-nucleotide pyrophosphorylase (carboxylating)